MRKTRKAIQIDGCLARAYAPIQLPSIIQR
jgi:hypothetical protein